MKLRIGIIATLVTLVAALPLSASAWWWQKDRETIIDVALEVNESLGQFNTLLALVTSDKSVFRRLDSRLNTTVFAPTDDAFDALFTFVEDNLCLTPDQYPSWYIRDVLNYHLVRGKKDSTRIFGASKVRMSFGGYVFPNAADLSLQDNLSNSLGVANAGIEDGLFDVAADNGYIHVIDRVLIPYLPPSNCPE